MTSTVAAPAASPVPEKVPTPAPAKRRKEPTYDSSSITVLEGLEAVRKRPGMYIGSTSERGLHHLVWEVVDNSVDEALAGHADRIEVTLLADGGVRVVDNGRGMPVGMHAQQGKPTVEVILTVLHAGGKFDSESYAVSGGLHGVGVSVVNALSHRLEVEIDRDGYHWSQPYVDQKPAEPLKQGGKTRRTGTTVTFWADATIFDTVEYNFETITRRLQEMAFLNKGLTIVVRDERPDKIVNVNPVTEMTGLADEIGAETETEEAAAAELAASASGAAPLKPVRAKEVTFVYPGGIADYVRHINGTKNKAPIHPSVIDFESVSSDKTMSVEIAMQWNESYSESVHTFANTINTHEGGMHEEGFRTALTNVVNRWATEKKLIKDTADDRLSGDDIREGLAAIVSIKLQEPQFEGQTKTKLGNSAARSFVQTVCNEWLKSWFERNPTEGRMIFNKASQAARARKAAQQARKLVRKSAMDGMNMPGKLSDCRSKDPGESEIYIVEGDSAGGSAKSGRDSLFQAILPIRGKIINVEKARIDRVLRNTEVQALITALRILDAGDVTPARLTGGYAGAMGQPQFMPSSYLSYAVDFDGDGRRDIWDSKADVFGSIGNYLAKSGWRRGEPWGQPVRVPAGFNAAGAGRENKRSLGEWMREGVTRDDGRPFRRSDVLGAVVLPDGVAPGEGYMVYANFAAIRRYNPSDFYAIAVGLLGDAAA